MAEPSRIAQALEYLGGLDAAVAPKLRAVSDAIDPVNVARRAGLNLPTGAQATEAAHFVGPGADIEGMVNDAREGNAAFGRGDLLGALGGYGSAAMAIPMMALPGSVKDVRAGVKAVSNALPMDEASRMARAADLGFEVKNPLYSGSGSSFSEFKLTPPKRAAGSANEAAVWLTPSGDDASHYARVASADAGGEGAIVYPLLLRPGKQKVIDAPYYNSALFQKHLDDAKAEGFDSVRFVGVNEGSGPIDQIAVLDPKNIRSRFASFDPAKKDSANLLASLLAAGVFGAGVAGSTNKEPE